MSINSVIKKDNGQYLYFKNDNGDYICPICSTIREKMNTMHYHYGTHNDDYRFACNKCEYKCMQKNSLENHILTRHSGCNEKCKQFKCVFPDCSFQSFTKGNCKIHCSRKHFKEEVDKIRNENNSCSVCNKTFKSNEAFDYHVLNCISVSQEKKKLLDQLFS
jgi:hypothetical protein